MATVSAEAVLGILQRLSHDIRDLDVGTSIDKHSKLPVVQFLRDYVAASKPCLLSGVVSHWPAYSQWTDEYLCAVAGDTEVTVALTPNGRADAVAALPGSGCAGRSGSSAAADAAAGAGEGEGSAAAGSGSGSNSAAAGECFAVPHQVKMPLKDFLELLRSSRQADGRGAGGSGSEHAGGLVVPYLQFQNSSLTAEVPQLLGDVDLLLGWATQAFGGLPEAVNLWIGDERSVTSWHKDPYENIFCVVAGTKTFTLMPPAELYRMRLKRFCQATYKPAGAASDEVGSEELVEGLASGAVPLTPVLDDPPETVLWSSVLPAMDVKPAADEQAAGGAAEGPPDLFSDPSLPPPLRVTVKAGEALYLPATWWHQVEQEPDASGRAIAVNYWYDMKWDVKQAYLQAVERLAELLGLNEPPPPPRPPRSNYSVHSESEQQLRPPYQTTRAFG